MKCIESRWQFCIRLLYYGLPLWITHILIFYNLKFYCIFFLTKCIRYFLWSLTLRSHSSLCIWLYSPCGPRPLFQFLNLHTVGRVPWTMDQPVARSLPTNRTAQTQNKSIQTSMLQVEFEPTNPAFERVKKVHALYSAAIVIGPFVSLYLLMISHILFRVHTIVDVYCYWKNTGNIDTSVYLVILVEVCCKHGVKRLWNWIETVDLPAEIRIRGF
jgi:hypothetical protein